MFARAAVEDVYSGDEGDIGWAPSVGESVAVLSMGGAEAAVVSVDGRKQTARIRAGMMEIGDVSFDDLRRLTRDGEGGKAKAKATKKKSAPSQQPSSPATTQQQPAIQTSANTVDLRGMTAEEARYEVEAAVGAARGGAVLFVIHGVGTGRVRGSVLGALRGNGRVRRVEQQEGSNGGCAIAWVE